MIRFALISAMLALIFVQIQTSHTAHAEKLAGRLITFKKSFDGWWDVACDTAPDGTDARWYVQYVDPYSYAPNFRAAMVDFLYRKTTGGSAEPVITFDVEPDLSFARDVKMSIVAADGRERPIPVGGCKSAKCVFARTSAHVMLVRWSGAKLLRLRIRESSGAEVVREWPLGNMREIVQIIGAQRKARGLP